MDRLSPLLARFSLHAGVFYTGTLCGIHDFERDLLQGHLHLVRRGVVEVTGAGLAAIEITEPTLMFLPRPELHRLVVKELAGADMVCGTVRFGRGGGNPITDSLPDVVMVSLSALNGIESMLDVMFAEAFSDHSGRQAILDRLCEVIIIQLLRYCIDQGRARGGTLAGLADPRLAKALLAMHEDPAREWTLALMAEAAGMSRARFAARFRDITGETPADYLTSWRIMTAQSLLRQGLLLKHVAYDVGYGSASALTRAFIRKLGLAPMEWLRGQKERDAADETAGALSETPGAPEFLSPA